MIYDFYWNNGKVHELLEIVSRVEAVDVLPETIGKLLNDYRNGNKGYNIDGWCDYLTEHGYEVRMFKLDYSMYF